MDGYFTLKTGDHIFKQNRDASVMVQQVKNILYISPSLNVKGGISSVLKSYLGSDLAKHYNIYPVASHVDGNKLVKLIRAIIGLVETLYYLSVKSPDIIHIHCGEIISFKRKIYYLELRVFLCVFSVVRAW